MGNSSRSTRRPSSSTKKLNDLRHPLDGQLFEVDTPKEFARDLDGEFEHELDNVRELGA